MTTWVITNMLKKNPTWSTNLYVFLGAIAYDAIWVIAVFKWWIGG